jgi:hypothetical protein
VNNKDLEQFIPMLIDTMQNPIKVPDCVHKLAATTFVQAVEAPTLSIMVPLLVRGLRHDNTTAIKRKASVIIENMAKLVSGVSCVGTGNSACAWPVVVAGSTAHGPLSPVLTLLAGKKRCDRG